MPEIDPMAQAQSSYDAKYKALQDEFSKKRSQVEDVQRRTSVGSQFGGAQNYGSYRKQLSNIDEEQKQREADLKTELEGEQAKQTALNPFRDIYKKAQGRAEQYKMAFPKLFQSKINPIKQRLRDESAAKVNDIRGGYNSRGLLYSGLRAGDEASVSQGEDQRVAEETARINQEIQDQQNSLNQDVVNTGLNVANIEQGYNAADNEYRQALLDAITQQSQQRDQAVGGLLSAGGQLAGTIAGRLSGNSGKKKGEG